MVRRLPRSTRTATLFPSTALFRSAFGAPGAALRGASGAALRPQHVDMGGVVEAAVAEISLTEHAADQDQGRAGELGGTHLLADVGERAADDELVGPGGAVDHGDRAIGPVMRGQRRLRSEEHTSELQSLMRISYAVFCSNKKK